MTITLARRADGYEASIVRELLTVGDRPGMRSLAGGLPDPASFPADRLEAATRNVLGSPARAERALQYGPTDGLPELRALLTTTPSVQRVTHTDQDEFVVTTGSQQAVHLLAAVLTDPGDVVVVDDPCYLGASQVLQAAGAQLVGVPLDGHGLRVDVLADRLRAGLRPKLVYTVPAFQNPTGAVLDADRGAALAELARHYGFVVIEDDAYGALGFAAPYPNRREFGVAETPNSRRFEDVAAAGAPPVPLGSDAPDVVVTLGTVSKVLAPGLRVGWLRAPRELRAAVVRTKQAIDLHTSTLTQSLVAELLADRDFLDNHLARIRGGYASRGAALAGAFAVEGASFAAPRGGLFLWVRLREVDTSALFETALARGVMFVPGQAFAVDQSWGEHMRLSFATLPEAALQECAAEIVELAGLA